MSQIRAAFDIGSSHHKLTVARIDPASPSSCDCTPSVHVLHSCSVRVGLADALCADGTLSASVLQASRAAIQKLQAVARSYGADAMCGIATAVFRTASNGNQYLSSVDMPMSILCSMDEGVLAYRTALYVDGLMTSSRRREAKKKFGHGHGHGQGHEYGFGYDDGDVVVWDSGGGSTQFTTMYGDNDDDGPGTPCVIGLPFGSGAARAAYKQSNGCLESVRTAVQQAVHNYVSTDIIGVDIGKNTSLSVSNNIKNHNNNTARGCRNPVRQMQWKLQRASTVVLGIGNETSMFATAAKIVGKQVFTHADVEQAVVTFERVHRYDDVKMTSTLPKLLLLAQLMVSFNVQRVKWVCANGSCIGLLLSDDPRFWPPPPTIMSMPLSRSSSGFIEQGQQPVEDSMLVESM